MAFLGIGKNKKEEKVAKKVVAKADKKVVAPSVPTKASSTLLREVIIRPHITEKSGLLSQGNVYAFEVTKNSTKGEIALAITALYKVVPTKVSIVTIVPRKRMLRGRPGFSAGGKKAYVRLKEGDKIEFI